MGASFRNTKQILGLAGCDLLTISPKLLDELALQTTTNDKAMHVYLNEDKIVRDVKHQRLEEKQFRYMLNEDEMAHDKLADGIRKFAIDARKLEELVRSRLQRRK